MEVESSGGVVALVWLRFRGESETLNACLIASTVRFVMAAGFARHVSRDCLPAALAVRTCGQASDWGEALGQLWCGAGAGICYCISQLFCGQDVFGITRLPAEVMEGLKKLICLAGQNSTSQGETSDRLAMSAARGRRLELLMMCKRHPLVDGVDGQGVAGRVISGREHWKCLAHRPMQVRHRLTDPGSASTCANATTPHCTRWRSHPGLLPLLSSPCHTRS